MRKEYVASGKTLDAAIAAVCAMADTTIENLDDFEVLEAGSRGFLGLGRKEYRIKAFVEVPDEPAVKAAETTFGKRKSKKERYENKNAAKLKPEDLEIKPIVTVDAQSVHTMQEQVNRNKKSDSAEQRKGEQRKAEQRKGDRRKGDAAKAEKPRRESRATTITEGEMADKIFADARAFLAPLFEKLGVAPEYNVEIKEGILWISFSGSGLGLLIGRRGETLNSIQYLTNLVVNKRRHDHVRVVLDVEGYRQSREETLAALAHKMAEKAVKSGRRVELEPMNPHERRVVHMTLQSDKRVDTTSHGEEPYRRVVITARNRRRRKPNKPANSAAKQEVKAVEQQPQTEAE